VWGWLPIPVSPSLWVAMLPATDAWNFQSATLSGAGGLKGRAHWPVTCLNWPIHKSHHTTSHGTWAIVQFQLTYCCWEWQRGAEWGREYKTLHTLAAIPNICFHSAEKLHWKAYRKVKPGQPNQSDWCRCALCANKLSNKIVGRTSRPIDHMLDWSS